MTLTAVDRIIPDIGSEPDPELYHCEWHLWADRKRIRQELAALAQSDAIQRAAENELLRREAFQAGWEWAHTILGINFTDDPSADRRAPRETSQNV